MLPTDPNMLLSVVNTALRDEYPSLDEFCAARDADRQALVETLAGIDCHYDPEQNRFR